MAEFDGFASGKVRFTRIPDQFFRDIVPVIEDINELKVILYIFWFLGHQEGENRLIVLQDILGDEKFLTAFAVSKTKAIKKIKSGLEKAVNHKVLLLINTSCGDDDGKYYLLNSPRGRAAVEAFQNGKWTPGQGDSQLVILGDNRPNLYSLYESNIGLLTPMIADEIKDAEQNYPKEWIEEAILLAVKNNSRRWRYVESILRSWREKGKDGYDRRDNEEDRFRYVKGKFAEYGEY